MGRFGAVFTAAEALIHKNFILVGAFKGFFFVLVAFGRVILICFVAGTFGVFICIEGNVVVAVGRFLAGHSFGGLFSGAPFGNLIVVDAIIVGASCHEEFI
jgi:hypothetical protein